MAAADAAMLAVLPLLGRDAPRHCRERLPAYRFLPGLSPHPTADPAGHSFGRQPAVPVLPPPARWADCRPYLYGCDLYNRGFWWEAHEAWEGLWQVSRERAAQHRFLQGLIQAANAQLKLALNRPQAVCRLWDKAEEHFRVADVGARFMGLDLASWRARTAHYLAARLAIRPLGHEPEAYPLLILHNDAG